MRTLLLCLALALLALPAFAQNDMAMERPDPLTPQGENLQTPTAWTVRLDKPDDDVTIGSDSTADIFFVNMTPGWHVTTGPAGIYYHPASTAEGTYHAEMYVHLFDPKDRNEGIGLIFGGQDLDTDDQRYTYFLIRNSGDYLIKSRDGNDTAILKSWTADEAIVTFDGTEATASNTLAVEIGEQEVAFFINGKEVTRLPHTDLDTGGIVGFRFNHAVNVHVEDFKVEAL